ncbi:MAG TPA: hypothetical protein VMB73_08540 [Acetobacteraceae bacterium]|nr:hypothetical protein [Acetobacteraceae bacterium]
MSARQEVARAVQETAGGSQDVSRTIAGVGEAADASGDASNDVPGVAHALTG